MIAQWFTEHGVVYRKTEEEWQAEYPKLLTRAEQSARARETLLSLQQQPPAQVDPAAPVSADEARAVISFRNDRGSSTKYGTELNEIISARGPIADSVVRYLEHCAYEFESQPFEQANLDSLIFEGRRVERGREILENLKAQQRDTDQVALPQQHQQHQQELLTLEELNVILPLKRDGRGLEEELITQLATRGEKAQWIARYISNSADAFRWGLTQSNIEHLGGAYEIDRARQEHNNPAVQSWVLNPYRLSTELGLATREQATRSSICG